MKILSIFGFSLLVNTVASVSYTQDWFRGDADAQGGHVHEGIQLAARDGFLGVGETLNGNTKKMMVKRVDNNGNTVWTTKVGQSPSSGTAYSAGYSIIQVRIFESINKHLMSICFSRVILIEAKYT